MQFNKEADRTL